VLDSCRLSEIGQHISVDDSELSTTPITSFCASSSNSTALRNKFACLRRLLRGIRGGRSSITPCGWRAGHLSNSAIQILWAIQAGSIAINAIFKMKEGHFLSHLYSPLIGVDCASSTDHHALRFRLFPEFGLEPFYVGRRLQYLTKSGVISSVLYSCSHAKLIYILPLLGLDPSSQE
jgi:hypothetical protein